MFDLSSYVDLPLIWGLLIATAIFIYVLLDGFDLGLGIIFPFAPSEKCRNKMMNSIAPFWDGNETWLILGGGGLFAAFPLAYSILLPAFYIPIIIMLLGLITRGVAFEFRFKAEGKSKKIWDYAFHFGSLFATFFQGVMLGAFVQGVKVENNNFSGSSFDWLSGFSIMTGIALIFGYCLLGSTWLIMKTHEETQAWARKIASYVLFFVGFFIFVVSFFMPLLNEQIKQFWFEENFYYLLPIPVLTAFLFLMLWKKIHDKKSDFYPFLLSLAIFFLCYLGFALTLYPWIVPFQFDIWQAAAAPAGLSLLLVGVAPLLPLILGYTAYCYYVFRGKTDEEYYH